MSAALPVAVYDGLRCIGTVEPRRHGGFAAVKPDGALIAVCEGPADARRAVVDADRQCEGFSEQYARAKEFSATVKGGFATSTRGRRAVKP